MEYLDGYHWDHWDTKFYETDCGQTKLSFVGMNNIKIGIYLCYTAFVLFTGYLYGRHKGLAPSRFDDLYLNYKNPKTKFIELTSNCWFVLSTFIFPYYLCIIWLFYCMHFANIHYLNQYNPWILPVIIIYSLYCIITIISYLYYSNSNRCSKLAVRTTILFGACLTLFILYILMKNRKNKVRHFSFKAFYGNNIKHCFDLNIHKNPMLISVFFIIYVMITHHIFVLLRALTAKCCGGEYISKTKSFINKRKIKSRRNNKRKLKKPYKKNSEQDEGPNIDDIREYDSDNIDEFDIYDMEDDDDDDYDHFNEVIIRNRSDSGKNIGQRRRSKYDNEPNVDSPKKIRNEMNEDQLCAVDPPQAFKYL